MEEPMKRIILIFTLIALTALLAAGELAYMKTANLDSGELAQYIGDMRDQGAKILHYNENWILAELESKALKQPWQSLPPVAAGEELYLLSKIRASTIEEIRETARIILDLGSEYLIASDVDVVALRTALHGSFTLLPMQGIKFSEASPSLQAITNTRTEIQQLLSQVSADSVFAFIQGLQDHQTRYGLADNRLAVANWIKDQFTRFGISNAHLQPFEWNQTTQYNVVATIEGSLYPDEYIVIGGHHDSITYTTPYAFAPGADDNASGSTAALEMARVLMANSFSPKCSIRFVTFAAEEHGLWGSKHHANTAAQNNELIRLMINHDMIANIQSGDNSVMLMPYDGSMLHSQHAASLAEEYTSLDIVYGYMNSSSSDSYPFWQNGYPVVYWFETEFSPYYHSDQDITAHIDSDYCAEIIRASLATALSFSMMPSSPTDPVVHDGGDGASLHLSWNAVNDPGIDHFRVYYSENSWDNDTYVQTEEHQITIGNLEIGLLYYLSLCSVDTEGNESYRIFLTGTPGINPATPLNLTETPGLNQVLLQWDANTEMDHYGYWVYRSTDPAQLGQKIHIGTLTDNFLTDLNAQGLMDVYYYYRVLALDNDQNQSEPTEAVISRPVTLNNGILIVDESVDGPDTSPFQPTDAMVDGFFAGLMDNFETHDLDMAQHSESLRLRDIGIYSAILWHGMDTSDITSPYSIREDLARYLELGGNILYTGYQPSLAFGMNDGYPATFAADSYLYEVLGISEANFNTQSRFRYAQPMVDDLPALEVDSLKTLPAFNSHILRVEALDAAAGATALYSYGSDYEDSSSQGQFNGSTVAIRRHHGEGQMVTFSVPLYHLQQEGSRSMMNHIFRNYFQQSSSSSDAQLPAAALELNSYPNPFREISNITLKGLDSKQAMKVEIYNLRGQKIRTLHDAEAKNKLSWDATDDDGRKVSTGIYLINVRQGTHSLTRKMLKL